MSNRKPTLRESIRKSVTERADLLPSKRLRDIFWNFADTPNTETGRSRTEKELHEKLDELLGTTKTESIGRLVVGAIDRFRHGERPSL